MQKNRIQKILSKFYVFSLEEVIGVTYDNRRVAHYHIEKCGGSSINHSFYDLAYSMSIHKIGLRKKYIDKNNKIDISQRGSFTYKISSRVNKPFIKNGGFVITRFANIFRNGKANFIHNHYLPLDLLDREDTFSFTTLRDPVERLISRYMMDYSLYKKNDLKHYPSKNDLLKVIENPELYFEYLKENKYFKRNFYGILSTFSRRFNLEEAINNLKKIDCILWQENLNNDFKKMIDEYSISILAYKKNLLRAKDKNINSRDYPEISNQTKNILKKELSEEYKLISKFKS